MTTLICDELLVEKWLSGTVREHSATPSATESGPHAPDADETEPKSPVAVMTIERPDDVNKDRPSESVARNETCMMLRSAYSTGVRSTAETLEIFGDSTVYALAGAYVVPWREATTEPDVPGALLRNREKLRLYCHVEGSSACSGGWLTGTLRATGKPALEED